MLNSAPAARRALPSVDRLLNAEPIAALVSRYGRPLVVETVRRLLEAHRSVLASDDGARPFDESAFATACSADLASQAEPSLRADYERLEDSARPGWTICSTKSRRCAVSSI